MTKACQGDLADPREDLSDRCGMICPVTTYSQLLARLTQRAGEDAAALQLPAGLPAPLSPARIAEAEQRLGFPLHPLLAVIYRDVANGGFGPDYQLLSLIDGPTSEQAVDCYTEARANHAGSEWAWPEGVLPILNWGCGMYACVDCRSDEGTVLLFEPNPGDPDLAWWIDSPSLTAEAPRRDRVHVDVLVRVARPLHQQHRLVDQSRSRRRPRRHAPVALPQRQGSHVITGPTTDLLNGMTQKHKRQVHRTSGQAEEVTEQEALLRRLLVGFESQIPGSMLTPPRRHPEPYVDAP